MNAWQAAGMTVNRRAKRMSLERHARIVAGALVATAAVLALTVNPLFAIISALVGSGLVFAGVTDTCTMGMLRARLAVFVSGLMSLRNFVSGADVAVTELRTRLVVEVNGNVISGTFVTRVCGRAR